MVWTNNGTIFYPGERPSAVRPDLRISTQQLMQANSGMSFAHELYDPVAHRRNKNTASQIAVSLARRSGTPIMLTAGGDVRERADAPLDSRLVRALNGRHPCSRIQLDRWLKDTDGALQPDQRMALTMEYEATYGPLPNTNLGRDVREEPDADDTGDELSTPPPARRPSLGALGLRRQTRLTAREFEQKLFEHGVPLRQHAQLMAEAHRAGHICDEADESAMTFRPMTRRAEEEARRGTVIHTALRRVGLEPDDAEDEEARRREVCAQVARQCDAVHELLRRGRR